MSDSKTESVLLRAARMIKQGGRLSRDDDQEAWDMVVSLSRDHTSLASMFVSVCEELEQVKKDSGRTALMQSVAAEDDRVEQMLGQVLGYPRYADDPENFPGVLPDDPTVFVGVEVPLTLAMQAAEEIKKLRADRDALMVVLDPLLVAVEPVRSALVKDIDNQVEAKQEWAKHYNATCGNSNEMWFYSTEFRRSLEKELEPFTKAIREANEVYDRIERGNTMSEAPQRKFGDPTFIGGGVMLDHNSQTYVPYKWVGGKMVKGEPVPFPEDEVEMAQLQAAADGQYNSPEERIIGYSIFQDVVTNNGQGYRLNGVPITDEEAARIWEQSPDNPKNKKATNQQEDSRS